MGQMASFQETLRRLAMIDEGFVEDEARLGLDPAQASALDPKTAALLHVAACGDRVTGDVLGMERWPGAGDGTCEEEIADVLLAIAPVAGLGRVVAAAPDVATALGYDIAAVLEEPDGLLTTPRAPPSSRTASAARPRHPARRPADW
jgi:4-carboxymuconolactone decarboxylase